MGGFENCVEYCQEEEGVASQSESERWECEGRRGFAWVRVMDVSGRRPDVRALETVPIELTDEYGLWQCAIRWRGADLQSAQSSSRLGLD